MDFGYVVRLLKSREPSACMYMSIRLQFVVVAVNVDVPEWQRVVMGYVNVIDMHKRLFQCYELFSAVLSIIQVPCIYFGFRLTAYDNFGWDTTVSTVLVEIFVIAYQC